MRYIKYPLLWLSFVFVTVLFHDLAIHGLIATFLYHDFGIHLYVKIALYLVCLAITILPLLLCFDHLGNALNRSPSKLYPLPLLFIQQAGCTAIYIIAVAASGFSQKLSYGAYLLMWAIQDIDENAVTDENQRTWLITILVLQAILFTFASMYAFFSARKKQIRIRRLEEAHIAKQREQMYEE